MIHERNLFDQPVKNQAQQISFTENLDRDGNTTMFLIIEEAKETILDFSKGTMKVL